MRCQCRSITLIGVGTLIAITVPLWAAMHNGTSNYAQLTGNASDAAQTQADKEQPMTAQEAVSKDKKVSNYVLDYKMDSIEGTPVKLESFKGKVILMVNVASKCGNTPQYKGLEAMYQAHKEDGLVIIGFPANNFGAQEPGTNEQIAQFCTENYDVTFPMMAKISVKGKDAHPLYKQLAAQPAPVGGEPEWNFDKFLVNRKGEVVARFKPRVTPEDPALVKKINELLDEDS